MNMAQVKTFIAHPAVRIPLEIALVIGLSICWFYFKPTPEKAGQVIVATPAKEVKRVPVVDTKIVSGTVAVYKGGAKLKKKLTLPKAIVDDAKKEVLASSKIPTGEHSHTVTTVIDTDTGRSTTYVRADPLPWIALESRGEVGMYAGMKDGQQAVRVQVRQDFVQVKALHAGMVGSVDMVTGLKASYFVGIGVSYKW